MAFGWFENQGPRISSYQRIEPGLTLAGGGVLVLGCCSVVSRVLISLHVCILGVLWMNMLVFTMLIQLAVT